MSTVVTNFPTNYYYGNVKLDHAPIDYRQQRIDAELARQKAIASGVKLNRVKPSEKPWKDPLKDDGRKKAVYDVTNDRIYSSIREAAKALGIPYETVQYRARRCQSLILI